MVVSVVYHCESFGKQPHQPRAYTPEGRSGFQQEYLGRAFNTQLSLAFSKSPLETPDCCPACLTRTWLLGENGNSCGEGRQEELHTNNHTQAASAPHSAGALTVSLAGSERHKCWWLWGRGGQLQ